jgi:hypothetical protein
LTFSQEEEIKIMITFQEDSTSIIDSWLAKETLPEGTSAPAKSTKQAALANNNSDTRLGLGFKPSTTNNNNKSKEDQLLKNLKKGEKQKLKNDNEGDNTSSNTAGATVGQNNKKRKASDQQDRDLHGVVDDIEEESRTKISSALRQHAKQKDNTAVNSKGPQQQHNHNAPPNNKNKKPKIDNTTTTAVVKNNNNTDLQSIQSTDLSLSTDSKQPKDSNSMTTTTTSTTADGKPKRKKTRSKQKNIRRDNRADDEKPDHLKVGSKEYKGRPLTAETKAILGMEESTASKSKKKRQKDKIKQQGREAKAAEANNNMSS